MVKFDKKNYIVKASEDDDDDDKTVHIYRKDKKRMTLQEIKKMYDVIGKKYKNYLTTIMGRNQYKFTCIKDSTVEDVGENIDNEYFENGDGKDYNEEIFKKFYYIRIRMTKDF